jgi:aspartate kinase
MAKIRIGGIMQNAHLALLNVTAVPDRPGIAAAILGGLGEQNINVQFIVQCIDQSKRDQVALCVDRDDLPTAESVLHPSWMLAR